MRAVVLRDLALALRAGGGFGLGLAFFLIVVVLVPLGVGPDSELLGVVAPGVLWVGALLAVLLTLDRLFALDAEDGTLAALATAPLPLEGLVLAKALAHWLTTGLPVALVAPILGLMLNLPLQAQITLVTALLIGTPALSMIGAFGAALVLGLRRGGLLMSILVLPLYVPTLIFGAEAVRRAALDLPATTPLLLAGVLSLGAIALLPFVTAGVLRITLGSVT